MPVGRIVVAIAVLCLLLAPRAAFAQYQPPSPIFNISVQEAWTWKDGSTTVIQVQGPVTIQTDRAKMTADRAVIWITPMPGTVLDQQRAEIALIGNIDLQQGEIERSGPAMYVTAQIQGPVRLTANKRTGQNLSDTDLYRDALAMRPFENLPPGITQQQNEWLEQRPWLTAPPPPPPATAPTSQEIVPQQRVWLKLGNRLETFVMPDGKIAALLSGGVSVVQRRSGGDVIQLEAETMVLFTPLTSLTQIAAGDQMSQVADAVTSAYLEGDVRITMTPQSPDLQEQRLRGQRVYYDFATDRAVLTDAIIHMIEPQRQIPIVVRANIVHQLAMGEYKAEKVQLSSSGFTVPSYSLNADRAYIREYDTGDPRIGTETIYTATSNVYKMYNLPFFYWPWAAGTISQHGMPLRGLLFGSSRGFGFGVRTEWGVFESLGALPPEGLDLRVHADYFIERGFGTGLDGDYKGGFVTETGKQPWNFKGDFTSYFISDHGIDKLGGDRARVTPEDEFRYQVQWEHQHFFPNDWQVQIRAGLVSDPTFLPEYYQDAYNEGLPHDLSAYIKHQQQTEALTFGFNIQPNDFVTTAEQLQEQFEVEHVPELGYYRIGDAVGPNDSFTFFSQNTLDGLHYRRSGADGLSDLGFKPDQSPGLASEGTTGTTDDVVYRGDFRQELDYPFSAGQFRFMPYIMGRYTPYSKSPGAVTGPGSSVDVGGTQNRLFAGAGLRVNTAFWKVDDSAVNDLFDIHRVRHVVEPELNLFSSVSTVDSRDVFNYDEQTDAINDISGVQFALRQQWQTKRGGPGQWRSVDFFTLNLEANFFANQPDETQVDPITGQRVKTAKGFRGLFFPSEPEASIPRDSLNADALWRVSDSTALFYDVQYNVDENKLATTSIGWAAQRDTRVTYFLGVRYIGMTDNQFNQTSGPSTLLSYSASYQLSSKYVLGLTQVLNLTDRRNEQTSISLIRRFDRFFINFTTFYDEVSNDAGFRVGIYPEGLGFGLSNVQVQQAMVSPP